MCFRHLPIDFDDAGKAHLRASGWDSAGHPPSFAATEPPAGAHLKRLHVAPVTRIAGSMDFYAT
ncbi:MAG: hypothetical protein M3041_11600, partial [Acidobacteriota bacterium]|nr:hypothetical protein [Acidobacteriota bacterium]